jgi:hypothetical protein
LFTPKSNPIRLTGASGSSRLHNRIALPLLARLYIRAKDRAGVDP